MLGIGGERAAATAAVAATGSDHAKDAVPQMKKFKGKDKLIQPNLKAFELGRAHGHRFHVNAWQSLERALNVPHAPAAAHSFDL